MKNADNITVTVVYDNNECDERLKTDWGFSCFVEGLEKTILFDTGGGSAILLSNMRKLGLDPEKVDTIILSHVHHDHSGGLDGFLEKNHDVTVYLPGSLPASMKRRVKESGAKPVEVRKPVRICRNAYSTGELGLRIIEQSLVIETGEGLLVITGCAHPGIVNIVKKATKQLKGDAYLALGGFHLSHMESREIRRIVDGVKREGVRMVAPCHCSGEEARRLFEKACGKSFIQTGVGRKFEVSRARKRIRGQ